MISSPPAPTESATEKLALSWADVVLILIILAIGLESSTAVARLTDSILPPVRPDASRDAAIADQEVRLERLRAGAESLRDTLMKERVDVDRERATLAAIINAYPDARQPSGGAHTAPPDWALSASAQSQLRVSVHTAMVAKLTADVAGLEAEVSRAADLLGTARRERDAATTATLRTRARRATVTTLGLRLGAALALLFVAWAVLAPPGRTDLIHVRGVLITASVGLALMVLQLTAGLAGSLGLVLLLAAILLRRSSLAPRPEPERTAP